MPTLERRSILLIDHSKDKGKYLIDYKIVTITNRNKGFIFKKLIRKNYRIDNEIFG